MFFCYNIQSPNINTWFRIFCHHTDRERSIQGRMGHRAEDFGSSGDAGGNSEVEGQRVGSIPVLSMAGQRALVCKHSGL